MSHVISPLNVPHQELDKQIFFDHLLYLRAEEEVLLAFPDIDIFSKPELCIPVQSRFLSQNLKHAKVWTLKAVFSVTMISLVYSDPICDLVYNPRPSPALALIAKKRS